MDDTLIRATSRDDLRQRESQVRTSLRRAKMEVAADKSESEKQVINFCGIRITSSGIQAYFV